MTDVQYAKIVARADNLRAIFPKCEPLEAIALCKKLRRLEAQGAAIALRLCNGPEYEGGEEEVDRLTDALLDKVDAILHFREAGPAVFLNRDPRGYALKIRSEDAEQFRIEKDWGGYGLIAPEIK